MNISANQVKTVVLGYDRGTGKAQELHVGEDGRFVVVEGDWLWGAFKRKAKYLTKKNGFSREEWTLMEAEAICTILNAANGYDPSKGDYKRYLNAVVGNALRDAAMKIADERGIWGSYESLDAPFGEDGEGATLLERVLDGAGFAANGKLWEEPKSRVARRLLREHKADEHAKKALLRRLAEDADLLGTTDDPDNGGHPEGDDDAPMSPHDVAVREVGLYEDEDEAPPAPHQAQGARRQAPGFGDSARAFYEFVLYLDVASVVQGLEPKKFRQFCLNMIDGYSAKDAYTKAGITRGQWYNSVQPALKVAFRRLKYAL